MVTRFISVSEPNAQLAASKLRLARKRCETSDPTTNHLASISRHYVGRERWRSTPARPPTSSVGHMTLLRLSSGIHIFRIQSGPAGQRSSGAVLPFLVKRHRNSIRRTLVLCLVACKASIVCGPNEGEITRGTTIRRHFYQESVFVDIFPLTQLMK